MPSRPVYHRPAHLPSKAERARRYDAARQDDKNFYSSAAWREVRAAKLRANPLCEECGRSGRVELAVHVHHRVPRKERPELALEMSNLESLCLPCHNSQPTR